jgi:hypothetical protein
MHGEFKSLVSLNKKLSNVLFRSDSVALHASWHDRLTSKAATPRPRCRDCQRVACPLWAKKRPDLHSAIAWRGGKDDK